MFAIHDRVPLLYGIWDNERVGQSFLRDKLKRLEPVSILPCNLGPLCALAVQTEASMAKDIVAICAGFVVLGVVTWMRGNRHRILAANKAIAAIEARPRPIEKSGITELGAVRRL
jgi:hypothetical protein